MLRMKKSVMFLVAVLSLAATACSGAKPGEEFTMKDQASIRERNDAFVKAFNDKDVNQVLGIYAENSVFMPPNQPIKAAKGGAGHDRGKYLFVQRRMGDTWRYEYSMWNSDLPTAGN